VSGGEVELEGLVKRFGEVVAVDHIDLAIRPGEFFSLLGPSGCGKTTTLRLVAGFERPDAGRILIDGRDMVSTPPHKRPVNTVFQSYALFPHLDVAGNVGFGLRYLDLTKAEATRRIGEALALVQMSGLEKRKPTQLSGGQQQRVALARSLVLNPSVLLLDEPLGALDAKLRKALQLELKALQEEVGVTFIYVTHDQEEALTMSNRIAVMSNGRVEQLGTAAEVYEEPANSYIAEFLGVSNLMSGVTMPSANGVIRVRVGGHELVASNGSSGIGRPVRLCIRPERIELVDNGATGENVLPANVDRVVYAGPMLNVLLRLEGIGEVQAALPNQGGRVPWDSGMAVKVRFPAAALRVLPVTEDTTAA
jgi:spermidine/putrescine transport system ATP-binding protein